MTNKEIDEHIHNLMATYKGDITLLADAIGALRLGQSFGWAVLMIVYSPMTYRKYQKALNLEFKTVLPEKGEFAERSKGYQLVKDIKNFWKAVKREVYIDPKERTALLPN
ncbi:MAG: hypothetical protein PHS93_08805 [Candidatus Omnitrophica bacterium]|nr:hypothetical protein [Candidatus Omnitrophota bacterium]MDD5551148.1 hypothetical protein [Candidatus Omnitrophota bacterium]